MSHKPWEPSLSHSSLVPATGDSQQPRAGLAMLEAGGSLLQPHRPSVGAVPRGARWAQPWPRGEGWVRDQSGRAGWELCCWECWGHEV